MGITREFLPVQKKALRDLYAELSVRFTPELVQTRIQDILKDFYRRMSRDVVIGFFFDGRDVDQIALKQAEFLLRAMDATPSFSGKAPAQAHSELPPILPGHFDRRLVLLEQTLRDHALASGQIQVWVGFENAFRDVIVSSS